VAVRYALGAPLRPLVVTNIYNDPVDTSKNYLEKLLEIKIIGPYNFDL
jgi:hypothetical protein